MALTIEEEEELTILERRFSQQEEDVEPKSSLTEDEAAELESLETRFAQEENNTQSSLTKDEEEELANLESRFNAEDPSTGDIVKGVGAEVVSGGVGSVAGGLIGGAIGTAFGGVGAVPGALIGTALGGAAGSFLGSLWAQDIEGQEDVSMGRAIGATVVGAIPFGGAAVKGAAGAAKITGKAIASAAGREAVKGAALGATEATIATSIDEGRLPTKEEFAAYAGGGAAFGGALGAAMPKMGKSMDKFFNKTAKEIDDGIAMGDIMYEDLEKFSLTSSAVLEGDELRSLKQDRARLDAQKEQLNPNNLEDNLDWEAESFDVDEKISELLPEGGTMPGEGEKIIRNNMDKVITRVKTEAITEEIVERLPFQKTKERILSIVAPSRVVGKEARNEMSALRKRIASTNELGSKVGNKVSRAIAKDPSVEQKVNNYIAGGELDPSLGKLQSELTVYRDTLDKLQTDLVSQLTAEDMAAMNPQKLESITTKILELKGRADASTGAKRKSLRKKLATLEKNKKAIGSTQRLIKKIEKTRLEGNFTRREFRMYTDSDFVPDVKLRAKAVDEIVDRSIRAGLYKNSVTGKALATEAAEKHIAGLEFKSARSLKEMPDRGVGQPLEAPLKKKGDVGPAELEWLGEITDTGERISGTLSGVGKLVARRQTDKNIAAILTKDNLAVPSKTPVAGLIPLRLKAGQETGLHVTPEVQASINRLYLDGAQEKSNNPIIAGIQDLYSTAVGLSKATKVLLNPPSYAVQVYGNAMNLAGMGINPFSNLVKGGKLAFAEFGGLESMMSPSGKKQRVAFLKEMNDMTKYGIKGENILESDIRDAFERGLFTKAAEKPVGFFGKAYSVPDTVGRYIGWKAQQETLKKIYPGLSSEQYKRLGAEMINDTYQNYDRLSDVIKRLSRMGVMPQFASFTAEFVRNQYNQAKTIKQMIGGSFGRDLGIDMNKLGYSDVEKAASLKAMRKEGMKRGASLATLYGGTIATINAINADGGVTDENERPIKESIASWDQQKTLAIRMSADGKTGSYANVSYIAPIALGIAAMDAAMGDKPLEDLKDMVVQELMGDGTFVNRSMMEAINNRNKRGEKISHSEDDFEKAKTLLGHFVSEAFTPGISREIEKFDLASRGKGNLSVLDVLKRQIGYRLNDFSLAENNKYMMMEHKENADGSRRSYTKAREKGEMRPEELEQVYLAANEGRRKSMAMIARRNDNLKKTNHTEEERIQVMKDAKIGSNDILDILNGTYRDLPRTKSLSISDQYDDLEGETPNEKRREIQEIYKTDRILGKKLQSKWKSAQRKGRLGLTAKENVILGLDVADRASLIMRHPNPNGYLADLRRKNIATPAVVELVKLKQRAQ